MVLADQESSRRRYWDGAAELFQQNFRQEDLRDLLRTLNEDDGGLGDFWDHENKELLTQTWAGMKHSLFAAYGKDTHHIQHPCLFQKFHILSYAYWYWLRF